MQQTLRYAVQSHPGLRPNNEDAAFAGPRLLALADGRQHPHRSLVTKVLTGEAVRPFVEMRETNPGDRYLICSDGLSDYVPADVISQTLRISDPQRRPQELIRLALQRGSQDNITCIVADVAEGDSGYNIALLTGAPGGEATLTSA